MSGKVLSESESPESMSQPPVEVWFYIGALLGVYGVLLSVAGVWQWFHPPATVLASYHATFWAGMVLLLVGGIYALRYLPGRKNKAKHQSGFANPEVR